MASLKLLPPLILTLCIIVSAQPPESPPPPQSIVNAVDTLANSGYIAMSLTLQLIAPTLLLHSSATALTIFSPPDTSFSASGQPSLAHLLLHFSPLSLSPASLRSLPFSSTIPSLSPFNRLTVTTSTQTLNISLNNVRICESPIFDDGSLLVYAIDDFFDLNFTLQPSDSTKSDPQSCFQCVKLESVSRFEDGSGALKSRGYSIMASFLDLQLMGFLDHGAFSDYAMRWTVFAPVDEELVKYSGDFLRYSSLFMRHLVPCKAGWNELEGMVNGTVVSNNVKGFGLEITRDEDDEMLMVNGVEITVPDLYDSEWLVIHGIRGVIAPPVSEDYETDRF